MYPKKPLSSKTPVLVKITIILFAIFVASCEDLTDSLSPRDNIADTWKCAETDSHGSTDNFLIEITVDNSTLTGIKIQNFNNLNITVKATIASSLITIPSQEVDGFTISGSGTIKSNYEQITLTYSIDDGSGDKENYAAVCTKP